MSSPRVTFKVTTYWKRPRREPGLTSMSSRRLNLASALKWVTDELPDEAVDVAYDPQTDTGSYVIRWRLVPDEVKNGLA